MTRDINNEIEQINHDGITIQYILRFQSKIIYIKCEYFGQRSRDNNYSQVFDSRH